MNWSQLISFSIFRFWNLVFLVSRIIRSGQKENYFFSKVFSMILFLEKTTLKFGWRYLHEVYWIRRIHFITNFYDCTLFCARDFVKYYSYFTKRAWKTLEAGEQQMEERGCKDMSHRPVWALEARVLKLNYSKANHF